MDKKDEMSQKFAGLINDFDKGVLDNDIQTHYGSGSLKGSSPQIYMKDEGTYVFFIMPPFEKYSEETPWGGRIGLIVNKHWNVKGKDGKARGTYLDYESCFPWLKKVNPLKAVIEKWKDKGMGEDVSNMESSVSVFFNVLLIKSPMSEHKQFLATVSDDGKLVNKNIQVCTLESNITTLKFLQEQMSLEFSKYPLYDPIRGTMIQIKKGKKSIKGGGTRVDYKKDVVPRSPMWFEGLPLEEQQESIKYVLENLPNIYEAQKPNKYTYTDAQEAASRLDNIMAEKSAYLAGSESLSTKIPHKEEFQNVPSSFPDKNVESKFAEMPESKPKSEIKKEVPPQVPKKSESMNFSDTAKQVFNIPGEDDKVQEANESFKKVEKSMFPKGKDLPTQTPEQAFEKPQDDSDKKPEVFESESSAPILPKGF